MVDAAVIDEAEAGEAAEDAASEPSPAPRGKTLLDLEHGECRWPLGDIWDRRGPVTEYFCGEATVPGSSYCPKCRERAFVPKRPHGSATRPMGTDRRR
ncbi:MAG: GcrA family cell cycle regulator [Methylocystis sp.]|uniref:GcrA family cell cycle regulator n=1 Tax=Methylocystis sp. TaxID=1911079 RepID=UPI003DA36E96